MTNWSAPLVRDTASDTGLPDAESRQINALIFFGPVSAMYCCVLSNALLGSLLMSTTSTILISGRLANTSLNPFSRSSVLDWPMMVKNTTLPLPPSFSIACLPPSRPASRLLVPIK